MHEHFSRGLRDFEAQKSFPRPHGGRASPLIRSARGEAALRFLSALCTKRIWAVRNIMNREEVKSTVKEVSHKQTAYYCCEYVIRVFEYPQ